MKNNDFMGGATPNGAETAILAAQCFGKFVFGNPQDAQRQLKRMEQKAKRKHRAKVAEGRRQAYRCPHCGMWHIGRKKR